MSKKVDAVELALQMAENPKHGYDQTNRWGPDYDCSSFLSYVWQAVGVPVREKGATYTGNMYPAFKAAGFRDVTGSINKATGAGLQSGDVLLNVKSHTAMYIGGGKIVQAGSNEYGGITGGKTGDQTGGEIGTRSYYNFPWDYILRYEETGKPDGTYVVQEGDTLWELAEIWLGSGLRYPEIMQHNNLKSDVLYTGQVLKIPTEDEWEETETATEDSAWIDIQLPVLQAGTKGHSVSALQTLLYANAIALPIHGIDGDFGEETQKGVLQFQKEQGLVESGKADRNTWKALLGGK